MTSVCFVAAHPCQYERPLKKYNTQKNKMNFLAFKVAISCIFIKFLVIAVF